MLFTFQTILLAVTFLVLQTEGSPLPRRALAVTLPLKRAQSTQRGLHPQIQLQQRMNRAHSRLARMTGRAPPTDLEMRNNLHRRMLALEEGNALSKRYNRIGVPKQNPESQPAAGKGFNELAAGSSLSSLGVEKANAPTAANSLGLDIQGDDLGYLATIKLGTPPRDFLILMDSGSADFWVGAENCQGDQGGNCGRHNFLGPKSSKTFVDSGSPFTVTYGTGKISGDVITDTVNIAGLSLLNHTFGVATVESIEFTGSTTPFDGLMGLAQSALSQEGVPTPVESLASAGLIPAPITSYKIAREADNKNDGEITFGALDPAKFKQNTLITLANVNTLGFWEANLDAILVDGKDTGLAGRTAILDTGTTLIVAPAADAAAVHALIPGAQSDGQGGFTIPCTTDASVALEFGGSDFAIDTRDLALQPVDLADPSGQCVSGITSGTIGGDKEWLVGDVFLKNAYFSTNVAQNTLSLAKLA
ncbi:aspartic peptidase A1 [Pluteus cervinus]|uniref:Aspartic peptidase A1 n=1 Tax=Pluteus cervinus TaxID=181527 RepID=A0ACD3B586_9AGAR|nr:aspartic peptidase A1 [Pluteus cervinus]